MVEGHVFFYLVAWRINKHSVATYAVYFFLNFKFRNIYERRGLNDKFLLFP